ncbi:MAG: 8-amino-7-oxononanoate synthase [Rickettsiales bacterium]|nr:8-amino-7-oxononanoate synthase [Rickettsiales bacterium]
MPALDDVLEQRVAAFEAQSLKRELRVSDRSAFPMVKIGDKSLISFSCNDYLGLSNHSDVLDALKHTDVAGSGASRLITGNHEAYMRLEQALADYKGTEAALVFGSGYMANIGIIPALVGAGDLVLCDKLSHACILDGIHLSGAAHKRFAHNDMNHLEQLLEKHRGDAKHCLIITETVFSMDGDCAPLAEIKRLAEKHDAWVMSDDAHGLGVVKSEAVDIQMGTLSKALGCYGGYVCGSKALIDYLINSARSFMFTTGLPLGMVQAAHKALEIVEQEVERADIALGNARYFSAQLGLPEAQSCIVPLIMGNPEWATNASTTLYEEGFWVSAIRPPTVPVGTARLRFTFSALHSRQQIDQLIACINAHGWTSNTQYQRLDAAS